MRLSQALETRLQQTQRIDPRQILASEMLTWTAEELEAAVERELAENPALETREADSLEPVFVFSEGASGPQQSDRTGTRQAVNAPFDADQEDPMDRVASAITLHDYLRGQVGQVASGERAAMVRDLIEYVDERGYLVADLVEFAEDRRITGTEAELAVAALQTMDPAGIGARSLRECLVLQATYLEQVGEGDATACAILDRCWDDLVAHREARIAHRLGVDLATVHQAITFLQRSLTPYPGSAFRQSWESRSPDQGQTVRPDVIFRRNEAGFFVELPGDLSESIVLAPLWHRLVGKQTPAEEDALRRYVREHVERAEGFLQGMARRSRTLRAIALSLVELQPGFLETGDRAFLRPLTRATLSERLGLDESVISRAVAGKFARMPTGDVVPLDAFFGCAHAVREALLKLVAEEDPANPYSDEEIADILTKQGHPLARRTVAKYRGLEKILPARLRRRA